MKSLKWLFYIAGMFLFLIMPLSVQVQAQEFLGQLAYIGTDFNIYTLDPNVRIPNAITHDGSLQQQYQWPTWSTDGRLAYFLTTVTRNGQIETRIFVSNNGIANSELAVASSNSSFTYAYWAPHNCTQGTNCRNLAILLTDMIRGDLFVELVQATNDGISNQTLGTGEPFYYSWSSDGQQMLWVRNGQRIDIYDTSENRIVTTLPQSPGLFAAPTWSPVGDLSLIGSVNNTNKSATDLVVVGSHGRSSPLAANLNGPIAFSWSLDGTRVAYTDRSGPLNIIDAVSGDLITRTSVNGIFAFAWSPDSKKLAYLTVSMPPGSFNAEDPPLGHLASLDYQDDGITRIAWSIFDIENGSTQRYSSFIPTPQMVYYINFFDQFTQSHRLWSPDSRYLVYSELEIANQRAVINILDTSNAAATPISVAEGLMGIWSFN